MGSYFRLDSLLEHEVAAVMPHILNVPHFDGGPRINNCLILGFKQQLSTTDKLFIGGPSGQFMNFYHTPSCCVSNHLNAIEPRDLMK